VESGQDYLLERIGEYRVSMAGAGDPDPIKQIWEELWDRKVGSFVIGHNVVWPEYQDLRERIVRTVQRVTRKTIFPVPRDARPNIELIWAIAKQLLKNLKKTAANPAPLPD
jgi:hypothetical protein